MRQRDFTYTVWLIFVVLAALVLAGLIERQGVYVAPERPRAVEAGVQPRQ